MLEVACSVYFDHRQDLMTELGSLYMRCRNMLLSHIGLLYSKLYEVADQASLITSY